MIGGVKTATLILLLACSLAAQLDKESSSPIVSDAPCTATLGLPTCFTHNGLIDVSQQAAIGAGQYVRIYGYVSGEPNLTYYLTGISGFNTRSAVPGGGSGSLPPDGGGLDTWVNWVFADRNATVEF